MNSQTSLRTGSVKFSNGQKEATLSVEQKKPAEVMYKLKVTSNYYETAAFFNNASQPLKPNALQFFLFMIPFETEYGRNRPVSVNDSANPGTTLNAVIGSTIYCRSYDSNGWGPPKSITLNPSDQTVTL